MSFFDRLRDLKRRALLEGVEVPLYKAERQVRQLRWMAATSTAVAIVAGGVLVYRWQTGLARAIRILVERKLVLSEVSVGAYGEGIREVETVQLRVWHDKSLPERERLAMFYSLDTIRLQMTANREAMTVALGQAQAAQKVLPSRISSSTSWTDPLTGMAFRAGASREEMVDGLIRYHMTGPEQQAWLSLLASATRPGAQPLPSPGEILEASQ